MRNRLIVIVLVGCAGTGLVLACGSSGGNGAGAGGAGAEAGSPGVGSDGATGSGEGGAGDGSPGNDDGSDDSSATSPDGGIICTGANGTLAYSKYKWPFFGNMHQHTIHSLDAYSFGTRTTPVDSYQFAKGMGPVTIGGGTQDPVGPTVTLNRPLDFLAITDHSEWLGIVQGCTDPTSAEYATASCLRVRSLVPVDQSATFATMGATYKTLCGDASATAAACNAEQRTAWQDEQSAAAAAYEPCSFTSLVAYEWTSAPNGDTNHRNVFFRTATVPVNPLDSVNYPTTSALFTGLDQQCTGDCTALVVPHNTNLSQGTSVVPPTSATDLAQMQKYQRLIEIYQHKGDSECFYSPDGGTDPYCAFEYLNPGAATDSPNSYVRTTLETGMSYAVANAGQNPFTLGVISSLDDHNGAAGYVDENTYSGHLGRLDDSAALRLASDAFKQYGSGGLAVVWAEQNTRASIFAALERRETYGVSGPRLIVRFYETTSAQPCTADFPQTILDNDAALPMGSTFTSANLTGTAPMFAIGAWPDSATQQLASGSPGVAGIAAVQVIKAHGKAGADGGANIVEDPPYDVPISSAGACVTWSDPSFDSSEYAFYYVRVLQVPTWRWSHYDCETDAGAGIAGCAPDGGLDVSIQERAWTSPIWYTP